MGERERATLPLAVGPRRGRLWWLRFAFDSLLGEVLLWIFSLLLFLWALSIIMTYQVAGNLANKPYDEQLANDVRALAGLVSLDRTRINVAGPGVARDMLRSDATDKVYYQVTGPSGKVLVGDKELSPVEPGDLVEPGQVRFRDDEIDGQEVRVAYTFLAGPRNAQYVLVQVAETRQKREGLASRIVSGVIVPQFVIVPLAVLFVYLGLARGITPLQRLQQELSRRRPSDLTPVSVEGIPEEIRPVIESMNGVMQRLEHNLDAQRRFIADAAHQLKTPLTGLRTQTDLALSETDPAALRKALAHVAAGAEQLSHLTQQLLSLARAEATSEKTGRFTELDVREVAREVAMSWADLALAKNIDLAYEEPSHPLMVFGSAFLLHEMLANLLDNAVKYTPKGGVVTLNLAEMVAEGGVPVCVMTIDDTGIGIPAQERERVFERFYRALGVGEEGSGLGLSIVAEVVDQHGGAIELLDPPGGEGTRVQVQLPALRRKAA